MSSWAEARLNAHVEDEEKISPELRNAVFQRDGWACVNCYNEDFHALTVHHVLFRSRGGKHNIENLITLCGGCHGKLHHGKIRIKKIRGRYYISTYKPKLGAITSESTLGTDRLRRYHRGSADRWRKEVERGRLRTRWKKVR